MTTAFSTEMGCKGGFFCHTLDYLLSTGMQWSAKQKQGCQPKIET